MEPSYSQSSRRSTRNRCRAAAALFMSSFLLLTAAGRCATALAPAARRAGSKSLMLASTACGSMSRSSSRCFGRSDGGAFGFKRQRNTNLANDNYNYYSRRSLALWATATDEDEVEGYAKTLESDWNVSGLKKEVTRLVLRCHKKVGKANQRLTRARAQMEELNTNPNASLADLENCPDVDTLEYELSQVQERLRELNSLEEGLRGIKKKAAILPQELAATAVALGVDDQPPVRQQRGVAKPKGPRVSESTRKPYRRYYSINNIEIRVGKQAEDNDELTMSPVHRDGADWWMHASGCPGSHVVIRSHVDLDEQVVQDAAALAARQSKCSTAVIKVSLTRCRDISKPPGAKAGLVMLNGKVRTVVVNMKEAEKRLERLDATMLIN